MMLCSNPDQCAHCRHTEHSTAYHQRLIPTGILASEESAQLCTLPRPKLWRIRIGDAGIRITPDPVAVSRTPMTVIVIVTMFIAVMSHNHFLSFTFSYFFTGTRACDAHE